MTVSRRYYIIGILQFYRKNHITVQIKGSNYMNFEKKNSQKSKISETFAQPSAKSDFTWSFRLCDKHRMRKL